ncbi:hypothetical protein NIES2101_34780 [Calothrix sp. HK-06]|nr:hypothetical protein NIES2101_34780 [Calothrix sp. HK-06]
MSKLTSKQIEALTLLSSGMTQAEVAAKVGVSIRTLQRWTKLEGFLDAEKVIAQEVVKATVAATAQTAAKVVAEELQQFFSFENRYRLIKQECEYLDMALACVLEKLEEEKDLRAIDRLLKISERRSQLLNLKTSQMDILEAVQCLAENEILPAEMANICHDSMNGMTERLIALGRLYRNSNRIQKS